MYAHNLRLTSVSPIVTWVTFLASGALYPALLRFERHLMVDAADDAPLVIRLFTLQTTSGCPLNLNQGSAFWNVPLPFHCLRKPRDFLHEYKEK